MSLEVMHYAPIVKAPADIEQEEVVAFGDGRLGLAFKANEAPWSWSHLIDLTSFEAIAADDEEKHPAGVIGLGSAWAIGFGPIDAIADPADCAAGSLIVDPTGTWLVAGSAEQDRLVRFGLVSACRGRMVSATRPLGHAAYRVPQWRLSRVARTDEATEPLVLELGEAASRADGRRKARV